MEGEHNWEPPDADRRLSDTIATEKEVDKAHETQMEGKRAIEEWD